MQRALLGIAAIVLAALVFGAIIMRWSVEAGGVSPAGPSVVLAHPTPDPHP